MAPTLHATLTQGSVPRHLYNMALPMVWALLATMSYNAADTFFVAQLGVQELAAIGYTFPVVMVLTSIAIGLGAGTSSAVARAIGSGDQSLTRRLATDGVSLTFIIAVAVSLLGWLTIDPLFTAQGASPELLPLIREYMSIWYLSAPFLLVPMVAMASMRAMGLSHIQAYIMMGGAVLNVVLDPLLIFGLAGFPRLELQGAALATLFTRLITLIAAVYVLQVRMHILVSPLVRLRTIYESWKAILHIGAPAMVTNVIIPLASFVVVYFISQYGDAAVAGYSVAVRIEPIALIVFYALSGIVGPFCGQNLGAGRRDRLFEVLRVFTLFCLGFGVLVAVLLWLVGEPIAALFSDSDTVLPVAVLYLSIVPISYGAYGIVMAVNAAFNGLGMPIPGLVISFLRVAGIFLPLAWVLMAQFGLMGLFVATALTNLLVGAIAYLWLRARLRGLPAPAKADTVAA
ncbi:MATE family efflux transporter [Exilibacterium tricleocarpae]|uniref:MATE family efflux transporter n=1 Tax=Exilibacterium tricleocarpae TaxID=2591008 RepID=A0A545TSC8_9GAMM|nr:MATE family efflux transporter [Exilibacterium tricleocarpae]TQV80123.1 MATE family efflux transporter [Exilibacterium tricleocarpae]